VLGLLGPNGAGKSTTIKILTALLQLTSGHVRLDGVDVLSTLPTYRRVLGYVPEEPHLCSYLTGPEYLRLIGRLSGVDGHVLEDKIEDSCNYWASTTTATRRCRAAAPPANQRVVAAGGGEWV
jgi:ABC-2 type transport system ATP-binding protein